MADDKKRLEVGTIVRPQVADSRAAYEIIELGEEISRVKKRSDISTYGWPAVTNDGRILTDNLREQISRENTLKELFG